MKFYLDSNRFIETNNPLDISIPLSNTDQVKHEEAKGQLIAKRVNQVNRINKLNIALQNLPQPKKGKNFRQDMRNIVKGKQRF